MKRMLSVFLALLMLLSCCGALTVFAQEDENVCDCEHMPLIYIFGRQDIFARTCNYRSQ